jgi:hypothetical protein
MTNPPTPRALTHDEAFAVLDAVALDALARPERDAVLAHADNCAICRAELSQLRDTAAFLAFAPAGSAGEEARDRVKSRLMARVAAEKGTTMTRAKASRMINMLAWRRTEWMAVAASIMLVASMAVLASIIRDRQNLREQLRQEIASGQRARSATDSLRGAVMYRDSLIAGLTGKDVAMMTLTSGGTRAPFAHMFWDKAKNTWVLVAHNMPAPRPGMTYQLWLVTPTSKISAGTFDPKDGEAMVRATYALPADQLRMLAVTEEPAGGMPQPTGAMVMSVVAH